jgi:hypothetical protein
LRTATVASVCKSGVGNWMDYEEAFELARRWAREKPGRGWAIESQPYLRVAVCDLDSTSGWLEVWPTEATVLYPPTPVRELPVSSVSLWDMLKEP